MSFASAAQMFCTYENVDIGASNPAQVMFEFNVTPAALGPCPF